MKSLHHRGRRFNHHEEISGRSGDFTADEAYVHVISALRAVKSMLKALHEKVVRDPVTRLYSRWYLDERLAEEFVRAARQRYPVALLAIDLDFFKEFNVFSGTRNHGAGDALLRQFGAFLNKQVLSYDLAFRRGGDEFVFVCPGVSMCTARPRAEEIQQGMRRPTRSP